MKKISQFFRGLFRKQITFTILAIVFTLVTFGFIFYASTFLITELNKSITFNGKAAPGVKFDIEGYERLNLGR